MRRNSQAGCFHTALTKPKTIPLTGEPRQGYTPLTYSANYSAQGAFGGKKVLNRAVKTARGGASTAYEKNPDPLEDPGVFVEKSRVRAEGLEPSTHGFKGVRNSKQTLQDDGMLQQLRSTRF